MYQNRLIRTKDSNSYLQLLPEDIRRKRGKRAVSGRRISRTRTGVDILVGCATCSLTGFGRQEGLNTAFYVDKNLALPMRLDPGIFPHQTPRPWPGQIPGHIVCFP